MPIRMPHYHGRTLTTLGLFALALVGCATRVGDVSFPEPSPGFQPRRVYETTFDKAWQGVNQALDANRIAVASSDKAEGRLQTDHIPGPSTMYAMMLGGVGSSRYSYNIRLMSEDGGKIRISVIGKLEQTLSGPAGSTQYRDLTQGNQPGVKKLEDWLYEQMEKAL